MQLYVLGKYKESTDNCDCGNQTVGIAVLSVLLLLTVICSVGLVIWIVQLNKKLAQSKSRKM